LAGRIKRFRSAAKGEMNHEAYRIDRDFIGHGGRSDRRVGARIRRFFTGGVRGVAGGMKPL
jgi:hypothetical protein